MSEGDREAVEGYASAAADRLPPHPVEAAFLAIGKIRVGHAALSHPPFPTGRQRQHVVTAIDGHAAAAIEYLQQIREQCAAGYPASFTGGPA